MAAVFLSMESHGQAPDSLLTQDSIPRVDSLYNVCDTTYADSLIRFARKFIGRPYAYGSTSGKSFDCSGFTQHVFAKHDVVLPHSSASQAELCQKIKPKKAQKGDLVFFTGRSSKSKTVGHVAIVTDVDGERIKMIHATTHGGVMEEWYNDSEYFNKRFLFVGRINPPQEKK